MLLLKTDLIDLITINFLFYYTSLVTAGDNRQLRVPSSWFGWFAQHQMPTTKHSHLFCAYFSIVQHRFAAIPVGCMFLQTINPLPLTPYPLPIPPPDYVYHYCSCLCYHYQPITSKTCRHHRRDCSWKKMQQKLASNATTAKQLVEKNVKLVEMFRTERLNGCMRRQRVSEAEGGFG